MQYRAPIDGLRAIAVLPVILFHAGFKIFSGGYVGVDIFFVISGYLITTILVRELENGSFSIAAFYERRARRIMPALFLVLFFTVAMSWVWMMPTQFMSFSKSLIAVLLFCSNIFFWRQSDYFATSAELLPLLHTWSLAVEEQFYLFFPLILAAIWRFGTRTVLWSLILCAAISLSVAEWGWRNQPSANFYLAPTRAWELLAGSICALISVQVKPMICNLMSLCGIALIIFAILSFDSSTPFPSLYTLVPVLGTVLIIFFAVDGTWAAKILSTSPFVSIGLISYSAYLWHQPVFAFARMRIVPEPSEPQFLFLTFVVFLLAWATWKFVEQPFRRRPQPIFPTRRNFFLACSFCASLAFSVGLFGYFGGGHLRNTPEYAYQIAVEEKLSINFGLNEQCNTVFTESTSCRTSSSPQVLLWGDSFAMHLVQGLVASDKGVALQQHTKSGCAPILGVAQIGGDKTKSWAQGCIDFNDQVLGWLKTHKEVELVVLSSPFDGVSSGTFLLDNGELASTDLADTYEQKFRLTVDEIRRTGARVIVVSPTPRSGWDIGHCLARSAFHAIDKKICDFPLDSQSNSAELLNAASSYVSVHWLHEEICKEKVCRSSQGGVFIYRDAGHLSREGSAYLGRENGWLSQFQLRAN